MKLEAIVIGVSAGGWDALNTILPALPREFTLPVVIVQHLSPDSEGYLAQSLNKRCLLKVKEADEKEPIEPGTIYIAPANYHLLIEEDRTLSLSISEHVHYSRPSIDVLFETAAEAFGPRLIGVVLTGASADGSQGLKKIQERGGLTLVQDPATAESPIMPQAAIKTIHAEGRLVDYILPLKEIAPFLMKIVNRES